MTTTSASPPLSSTVVLRPIGSAMPAGYAGLAVASLTVSGLELGWVGDAHLVGVIALVTAVPLFSLASLLAYLARDGATAGTMAILDAGWAVVGLGHLLATPGATTPAAGLALLAVGGVLVGGVVAVGRGKPLSALVAALTGTRFALSGIYELTGVDGWKVAAGAVGLAVVAAAAYACWAFELEDSAHRALLPTFRLRRSRRATEAPAAAQVADVEHEPGVRQQL